MANTNAKTPRFRRSVNESIERSLDRPQDSKLLWKHNK